MINHTFINNDTNNSERVIIKKKTQLNTASNSIKNHRVVIDRNYCYRRFEANN